MSFHFCVFPPFWTWAPNSPVRMSFRAWSHGCPRARSSVPRPLELPCPICSGSTRDYVNDGNAFFFFPLPQELSGPFSANGFVKLHEKGGEIKT